VTAFKVCLATNRVDEQKRPVWRDCGTAKLLPGGTIDVTAWTVFGKLRVGLYPARVVTSKGPSHIAGVSGDNLIWDMGVAYRNQSGGYNVVLDSPGGEWRLFLFPEKVLASAQAA
jgi:hypothetical protein